MTKLDFIVLNSDSRLLAETYDVDSLSEVVWGQQDVNDPFPGLILDDKKQKLIQANCRTAEARRLSPDLPADRIGGTGEGTIILLHGLISPYL